MNFLAIEIEGNFSTALNVKSEAPHTIQVETRRARSPLDGRSRQPDNRSAEKK
jgi:hypothetical protein